MSGLDSLAEAIDEDLQLHGKFRFSVFYLSQLPAGEVVRKSAIQAPSYTAVSSSCNQSEAGSSWKKGVRWKRPTQEESVGKPSGKVGSYSYVHTSMIERAR